MLYCWLFMRLLCINKGPQHPCGPLFTLFVEELSNQKIRSKFFRRPIRHPKLWELPGCTQTSGEDLHR